MAGPLRKEHFLRLFYIMNNSGNERTLNNKNVSMLNLFTFDAFAVLSLTQTESLRCNLVYVLASNFGT